MRAIAAWGVCAAICASILAQIADTARQEDWPEEGVAIRIEQTLGEIFDRQSDRGAYLSVDFRGTPLVPRNLTASSFVPEVRIYTGNPSLNRTVSPESFDLEVRNLLEGYRPVGKAAFRVTKVEPRLRGGGVQAVVRYTITGTNENRGPRQDHGEWRTEWIDGGNRWLLTGLDAMEFSRADSPGIFFRDTTAAAFAKNRSFLEQLNRGTAYWAEHLDAASQIDLYGLNGIAAGDFDGDGWEDLYVCQPGGLPNLLFRNRGDGMFEDVTARSGLDVLDSTPAALWADYDNDGDQDLFVITSGEILLFENDGHGRFKRSARARFEIPAGERGVLMMAALADYDRDGFLDLYVCQYSPAGGSSMAKYLRQPTPYHNANNGPPNQLFHNDGDGTFTNVTHKAKLDGDHRWSFAAAWADYNGDGYPDLFVANDFGLNNLYRNNGDGTFTDVASSAGLEHPGAGMSVAWGDYDNDGRIDVYVSKIWSAAGLRITRYPGFQPQASALVPTALQRFAQGNSLYRNQGNGAFEETTARTGTADGGWAWASDFFDFNNDGWEDLFVVNGHITNDNKSDLEAFHWTGVVASSPPDAARSKKYEEGWRQFQNLMSESGFSIHGGEQKRLFLNLGKGRFADVSGLSGLDFPDDGRAFSILDFDNDGDLDLVVKNRTAPQVRALRNDTSKTNHSVAFELTGRRSNRDAVGAKVILSAGGSSRIKEVRSGSGFLSQHTKRLYFGLGANTAIGNVRIDWPSGARQELTNVPADALIRIEEGVAGFSARPFHAKSGGGNPAPEQVTQPTSVDRGIWLLEPLRMPRLELSDAQGKKHSPVEDFRGRPFLIHLPDSGCTQCEVSVGSRAGNRTYRATPGTIRLLHTVVKNMFARRRAATGPVTLLVDEEGYLVKIYRVQPRPEWILEDLDHLPRTARERVTRALPFAGQYHGSLGSRLEAYFLIAVDCLKNALPEESLTFFRECLRIDPRLGPVVNNIGTIHARTGQLDAALDAYREAGRLDPQSADIRFNLGTTLAMRGRFAEAVPALEEAARMDPASVEIWTNLGNAYLDSNQPAAAEARFERAVRLDPKSALAHNSLGTLYGQQGKFERAIEELESAIRLQPDYEPAYLNLGIVYLKKQDRRKAAEMFRKVLQLDPRNAEATRMLERLQ